MAQTLTNARLVLPDGVRQGWLRVEADRIAEVGTGPYNGPNPVDSAGAWVVPGAVDIHVHGGAGASFTDAGTDSARSVAAFNHSRGSTTAVAGLVTAAPAELLRQVAALVDPAEDGDIAGIYIEGPYISAQRCGAHDPELLRPPDLAEFQRLLKAGHGHIRMITIAPELPGALDLIRAATAEGVVAAVGHTEADYDQTRAAFDAGATVATHLFNAMRPLHHREPGPIAAALTDERVTVEVINDGVHVHPGISRLAFDTAGADRVALITDAMSATGLGDGEYTLGKLRVRVSDGHATLAESGVIASSTIVSMDALRRAVHEVGLPIADAARAAATTPARALGLSGVGSLTAGGYADLVLLDDALNPARVMRRGEWLS